MFDNVAWISFIVAGALTSCFFFFKKRRFDFLTVAYIGAIFYFLPLFFNHVLQSSPEFSATVSVPVFLIATTYMLALVLAAILSEPYYEDRPPPLTRPMSGWYAVIAVAGLVGAIIASKGEVIDADKVQALKQVGYFYVLFEFATSLACISAVMERRWWIVAASVLLLAVDLLVGFRVFVVLTALSVTLVMLIRDGRIRLFTKAPTYGVAALFLIASMLLLHSARYPVFEQIAKFRGTPESSRAIKPSEMRGDTIQYSEVIKQRNEAIKQRNEASAQRNEASTQRNEASTQRNEASTQRNEASAQRNEASTQRNEASTPADNARSAVLENAVSKVLNWIAIPFDLLQQSEPFMIQATFVAVVQRPLSCEPSNIFKSLYLLVPPGLPKIVPNPYPLSFYDEFQPVLYPNITYGMGGNIWAEMLCRFGYAGVAIFGALMIFGLVGLYRFLIKAPRVLVAPITLGGAVVAFYMQRNDVHNTLVLLRQMAFVFGAAYALSFIVGKFRPQAEPSAD
jgi:hypothetical protein